MRINSLASTFLRASYSKGVFATNRVPGLRLIPCLHNMLHEKFCVYPRFSVQTDICEEFSIGIFLSYELPLLQEGGRHRQVDHSGGGKSLRNVYAVEKQREKDRPLVDAEVPLDERQAPLLLKTRDNPSCATAPVVLEKLEKVVRL